MSVQLISTIVYTVLLFGVFYVMFYFPDKKTKMKHEELMKSLKEDYRIVTKSGIVGKIVSIGEEYLIIETEPDCVNFKILKTSVSQILK